MAEQSSSEAIEKKLREAERKLTIAEDHNSVKDDKIAALESTISELQSELWEQQERCSSAMQAVEQSALAATDACRIAENNLSDSQMQLLEKENALVTLQMKCDQAEALTKELRELLQAQHDKNEQLVSSFQAEREQWEAKQAEISSKEGEELRQELEAEGKRCSQLWDKVQVLQTTNESLQKDLEVVRMSAEAAEQSHEAKQAMAFQEKAQRAEKDAATIKVLERKLRAAEEEKEKTQEKLDQAEAQLAQKLEIEQDGGFVKIEPEEDEGLHFYKIA